MFQDEIERGPGQRHHKLEKLEELRLGQVVVACQALFDATAKALVSRVVVEQTSGINPANRYGISYHNWGLRADTMEEALKCAVVLGREKAKLINQGYVNEESLVYVNIIPLSVVGPDEKGAYFLDEMGFVCSVDAAKLLAEDDRKLASGET